MSFPASLLEHLARYKIEHLGVAEDGVWSRNKRPYKHLLPEAQRDLNILEAFRTQCLDYIEGRRKKLHRDFHHLNSSQAFALNTFFPILSSEHGTQALREVLELDADIVDWEFEAVPRADEETNFDLLLTLTSGSRVYVEVKLTETGFGSCAANERRLRKLERIYRPQLQDKVVSKMLEPVQFFKHYQLLRNVSYIDDPPESRLLLVFPRANDSARREAHRFVSTSLLPEVKTRVSTIYADDLIAALLRRLPPDSQAVEALLQVVQKYALDGGTPTTA